MDIYVYKSHIMITFKTTYEKSELVIYDDTNNKISGITYYQLTNYVDNENEYKIYIDYTVEPNVIHFMLKKLTYHTCICDLYSNGNNTLYINCNSKIVYPFIKKIIAFNIFDILEFGKCYNSTKIYFSKLKNVKHVEFLGKFINFCIIPKKLNCLEYKVNTDKYQIIKNTQKTQCIFLKTKTSNGYYKIDDVVGFNKILFVSNKETQFNLSEIKPDCIVVYNKNNCIDWTNLPNSIRKIVLYNNFDETLDYLPDTINEIVFAGNVNSSLLNLPSSTKSIKFKKIGWEKFCEKVSELPDFVKLIYLGISNNDYTIQNEYFKLPEKLKSIDIVLQNYYTNYNEFVKNIFDKYKVEHNVGFNLSVK